jgi:hypothetical protein
MPPMTFPRILGCLLGACTLSACVMAAPAPAASLNDRATWLLPDIEQAPVGCHRGFAGDPATCNEWDVCMVVPPEKAPGNPNACVTSGPISEVRLRFTSSEENVGDGPLLVYGHREAGQEMMNVRQAFADRKQRFPSSWATAQRPASGHIFYDSHLSHQHWHYLDFDHFALRTVGGDNSEVVGDRKSGFCLGDRYVIAGPRPAAAVNDDDHNPMNRLHLELQANECEKQSTDITDLREGISVGRGDDYAYDIDLQWLDITHVPSGVYDLVNSANTDRSLLEKSYSNNSASATMSIQWPDGAQQPPAVITAPPVVTMLKSCADTARCAVPTNLKRPRVSGHARVKSSLRGSTGTWAGKPGQYEFQWLRDGRAIAGATGRRYKVKSSDRRHRLAFRVTAITQYGSTRASSRSARVR